jgi:hypothetical protein
MVFKGGTSLSKVWRVIKRFSEDIDIAVDRSLFGLENKDLTKKQIKTLRKKSSLFVRDILATDLTAAIEHAGLSSFLTVEAAPDGEGDSTYPEPRQIHIYYQTVLPAVSDNYLREEVLLEVGARSLFEPTAPATVQSFVTEVFPHLSQASASPQILVAVAEKTFLEKAFLLHELFTTDGCRNANRKSRHLYDLCQLMKSGVGPKAIDDTPLWESIAHHREVFTSVHNVDYSSDIRKNICLLPPGNVFDTWRADYETMVSHMIYDNAIPSFEDILKQMADIQSRFREK